jgi:GTPase SAR1 family protein
LTVDSHARLHVPPEWEAQAAEILERRLRTILVIGGSAVGKSSFCHYLVGALLARQADVAFVDADIGQSNLVGGVPTREIARRIGVAASTVRATLKRFRAAGLSWPLPEEMTDAMLGARLFANAGMKQGHRRQIEPDWASTIAR